MRTLRERTYALLEPADDGNASGRIVQTAIMTLIAANIAALVVETVPNLSERTIRWLSAFEVFSVAVFSIEYLVRLWSTPANPRFAGAVRGRVRFAATPLALVDLAAILPFFLPFVGADLRFLRAARLFRLLRTAKLVRYSASLRLIGRVLSAKKEQLVVVSSVVILLLLVASSIIYLAENAAQPDKFSSIPAAMWWAVATLSTVGYGDVTPVTAIGRLFAGIVALLGIGMFALPAGILGSGFVSELERTESATGSCPRCGQPLPGRDTDGPAPTPPKSVAVPQVLAGN